MNLSILETVVKISTVMALAAVVAGLMRRRASAASRHLVWTLATIAVLAIPLATIVMPGLPIPIQRASVPAVERVSAVSVDSGDDVPQTTPATTASSLPVLSWLAWLPMFYAAGVMVLLGRLAVEQWRARALLSRTAVVDDVEWTTILRDCAVRVGLTRKVRLVRSREETMPMTVGIRRPVIVMPSMAELWDRDRRRAVLLHELAHVARVDCLTQTLAEIAVAVYWPHPGAWLMARQLRVERELACDDCVLSSGTEPREYAGHLLEIAHSLGGYQAPALVVSMARPQQLEGRMLAMLDATRNRATPAASRRLLAIALTAMVMAPLAAATTVTLPSTPLAAAPPPAAAAAPAQDRGASSLPPGTWQIRVAADGTGAQLTVSTHAHSFQSMSIPLNRIEGLAALLSGPAGPVHYSVKREAGTFDFEGTLRSGVGGGTFTFAPSAAFSAELVKRGFDKPTLEEQQALAGADIGFAFVDELATQKYTRPSLAQLVNAARHGVSMIYIREMSALGYRLGTVDALIRQRDHGVDPQFIRDLQAQGLARLTGDDLVRARDHGIDPAFIRDLRAVGYASLDLNQLVSARDHGVGPDYIRDLRQLGYQLPLADLIAARDHGVDAAFAKDIAAAGYQQVSMAQLIQLRDHGVTPQYAQQGRKGGTPPSVEQLIHLHDRGESADATDSGRVPGPRRNRTERMLDGVHRALHDWWTRWFS